MNPPLLVTIGPSHYCEKARWALERAGIAFEEEAHAPMVHWAFTLPRTGTRTAPILIARGEKLTDSKDILLFCDRGLSEERRLFPNEREARREVMELSDRFDGDLGPTTRRLAYAHLVDAPDLFAVVATHRLSSAEARFVRTFGGVLRGALRRAFRIRPGVGDRMFDRLRGIFGEVSERLSDGRRYLVGNRFSAADLTFASLAMPCLDFRVDNLPELPRAFAEQVEELRATPAGVFAMRLSREERTPQFAPST